ncbi:DUF4149 domain-containing protein [Hydrogenobacter sp. T-2]|uniref:DUF4149 domain-containing protein n=1 Tax=Pampinifervens diazotrophicum TaxID=1632018 RepID=UPI002B25C51F|nr:DUF4149 domain-containing protein [Hydrogenobacter sp. T-2]WPM32024.1 DUF4149 domain-containing protein [Hydrogenobacter sp. T-2]
MLKFLLFINSLYLGLGSFFSFFIAPTLFKVLQKEQAGVVVEKVFPVYFSLGLVVSLITLILGFKYGKLIFGLALVNALTHALHIFYVLPTAHNLKMVDYQAFMKWHGISMGMNLLSLFLTLLICIVLMRK